DGARRRRLTVRSVSVSISVPVVFCSLALAGGTAAAGPFPRPSPTPTPAPVPDFGDPLAGLDRAPLDALFDGKATFEEVEGVDDGLGPVFNDVSCVACHDQMAVGGPSERLVTRFGRVTRRGFDPLANLGGTLIQSKGIGPAGACNYVPESVPPEANVVSHRR